MTKALSMPDVGVVLATHNRPALMRRALASILDQDYDGRIVVMVVHDKCPIDYDLIRRDEDRIVEVCANSRAPGLAGARNTGITSLETELIAFCDDDDQWRADKLTRQVRALQTQPDAEFASTAMLVDYGGQLSRRFAGTDRVEYADLLRSRMAMVHSSSFLAYRDSVLNGIGVVDESIPQSMCEDWDLLLRAARRQPIVHVDDPLVIVAWGASSYFNHQWSVKNTAHEWMLERHPDILTSRVGAARVYGQLAFGHAALKKRREAVRWAWRCIRTRAREPRGYIALAVTSGLVSDGTVMRQLQRRGHGI